MSPAARARLLGLLAAVAVLAMHGGGLAREHHPTPMAGHQQYAGAPAHGHSTHPAAMVMGHPDCAAIQTATPWLLGAPAVVAGVTAATPRPASQPPGTALRAPPDLHRLCVSRT